MYVLQQPDFVTVPLLSVVIVMLFTSEHVKGQGPNLILDLQTNTHSTFQGVSAVD